MTICLAVGLSLALLTSIALLSMNTEPYLDIICSIYTSQASKWRRAM